MKISCNILKKHIKNSEDIDFLKIWDKFTIRTAEVEGVEVKGKDIDSVVTAKILEVADHPKSTKLHILKVDDGKEIKQIVCGAPNVKVGLISALIEVGGHLGDIEIGVRPLVGVESYGMMCSAKELGISDDHTGIIELPEDTPVGINIKELMPIDDIIVEIDNKSLTHRPDLWGHYGIAREIAAITNHELLPLDLYTENPDVKDLDIKINNPELCYRYIGTKMENITNNVTPLWMQVFLYYAGMRSINLLVDLTNYIMLELGQPMHAFDARVVKNIEVGLANNGDKYTTLDGTERNLTNEDLMIKNGGKYFAIAGVMGGLDSEIVEDTTSIVLESATFNAYTVRKTALSIGLRTEASARYEKSLDPNLAMLAARRFIKLLKDENKDLTFASNITDVYPKKQEENHIELKKDYLYKSLGFEIEDELVNKILTSLEFKVTPKEDSFEIIAPTFRSTKDITIAADIVEEISRMYGYENFEHIPLKMDCTFVPNEPVFNDEYEAKRYLANNKGYHEIHTYLWHKSSFLKKLDINLENTYLLGKTDDNILRKDLSLAMLESAIINLKNYNEFGLFEIGTTINDKENHRRLSLLLVRDADKIKEAYYEIKTLCYNLFNDLKNIKVEFKEGTAEEYYENDLTMDIYGLNKCLGQIKVFNSTITNKINKKKVFVALDIDFDLFTELENQTIPYEEVSKYPVSTLDYTIISSKDMLYSALDNILSKYNNEIILNYKLMDIYENDNNKKITIRYNLGSKERTLTSEELENFKIEFINHIRTNKLEIQEN